MNFVSKAYVNLCINEQTIVQVCSHKPDYKMYYIGVLYPTGDQRETVCVIDTGSAL